MPITVSAAFKAGLTGPVDISKPRVQINFYGALWIDVADLVEGSITGRMEESPVGGNFSSNYCFVTFNNDDGRFSPLNSTSDLYGYLTPNKPIVIDVLVNGEPCRIFTGVTSAWPPQARARKVTVKCYDKARIFANQDIVSELVYNQTAPGTGLSWNFVFERACWLAGLRWDYVKTYDTSGTYAATSQLNPDGSTTAITVASGATTTAEYRQGGAGGTLVMKVDIARSAAGAVLMLKATNVSGKVLKALSDLAMVIDGRIFFDGQGALRVRSRMYVADPAFSETITIDDLDDCQFTQNYEGTAYPLYNSIKVQAKPLAFRVDSGLNLVEEPVSFLGDKFPYREFSGGQTFPAATDGQQFASLPDGVYILKNATYPAAANFSVKSALSTDLITDLGSSGIVWAAGYPKFGTNRVELKLTNNNAKTAVLTELTLNAKLVAPRVTITAKHLDQASIDQNGQKDFNYQNDFISDNLAAQNLCSWLLVSCKDVKPVITLPLCYAMPWAELGDTWRASETTAMIIPAPTDFVIRAYDWSLSKESYTMAPEVVPIAPAFVLQSTVGGITETSNAAAGAKGDDIPYGAISGVGKQVGLDSVQASKGLLNSTRKVVTDVNSMVSAAAYYAGYLYAFGNNGYLYRFDAQTLSYLGKWQIDVFANYLDGRVFGKYLYLCDAGNDKITWVDLSILPAYGAALGAATGTKIDLWTSINVASPDNLLLIGTKLYIHAKERSSPTRPMVVRIDVASNATVTAAEIAVLTANDVGITSYGIGDMIWSNQYLWCLSSYVRLGTTLSTSPAAGVKLFDLTSVANLAAGMWLSFGTSGNMEHRQIESIAGNTVTVTKALLNSHASGETCTAAVTKLAKVDTAAGTAAISNLEDGPFGEGFEFDGSNAYVSYRDRVVKYRPFNGVFTKDREAVLPTAYYSSWATALLFDGTYLWTFKNGKIYQFDPRSLYIVGAYPTDAFLTGRPSFIGTHVLACGSDVTIGALYVIPRWSSAVI